MLSPKTENLLLPPQRPHAIRLLSSLYQNGFAIDMSDMGTGKTFSACAVLKETNLPFVILCPNSLKTNWERTTKSFGIKPYQILNYEKIIRGNTKFYKYKKVRNAQNQIIGEQGVFKNIPPNVVIVFEEAHKCKGLESSTAELLFAAKRGGFKRLKISGSMATNPLEMFAFGYSSGLHTNEDRNSFKRNFCQSYGCEYTGKFGQMTFDPESDLGRQGMLRIHNILFEETKVASRLTKAMMGDYFPQTKIVPECLDMGANSPKIQKVYDLMQREIDLLEKHCENYSQHVFAVIMKSRRQTELLKVPVFVEQIESAYNENNSVAVFVNFKETITAISDRLNRKKEFRGKVAYVIGGQDEDERQECIDGFQSDKYRVILCNMKAGGVGISLHDINGKHSRVSLHSPGFSAIELIQALGRVDRQGGKSKSYQRIIYAADTIEESACDRLQYRIDNLAALNDHDLLSGIRFYGQLDEYLAEQ